MPAPVVAATLPVRVMSRVIKRSVSQAVKSGPSRRGVPLPQFIPPQLSMPVEKPPSGAQWPTDNRQRRGAHVR